MKINMDKAVVEFIPENQIETAELEALWIKMGNCVGDNKKLSPIGVYTVSYTHLDVYKRQAHAASDRSFQNLLDHVADFINALGRELFSG